MSRRLGIVALALAALLAFGCEHYPRRHRRPTPTAGFRYYWGERGRGGDHERRDRRGDRRDRDRDRRRDERRRGDDHERRARRDSDRDEQRRGDDHERRDRRDRHRD